MLMRLENRPPSARFITWSGRKSGDERAAPMAATRSCVWGDLGLSTMTTRAGVVAGAPSIGCTGVPPRHAPNILSASARRSAIEMSPATMSAALLGTTFCLQKASMSSRVIALIDASVPSSA